MIVYDDASFSAGQDSGTRVAACVVRLAALELTDRSRWWNRRRNRLMARALVACAEELEAVADEDGRRDPAETEDESMRPRARPMIPAPNVGERVPPTVMQPSPRTNLDGRAR